MTSDASSTAPRPRPGPPRSGKLVLALVGHPVAHSLSPVMHRAACLALGVEADYDAHDVVPDGLRPWVVAFDGDGFNVTVPHKEAVLDALGEVDADARAIGAVNTVLRTARGRLSGSNTDAPGLVAALAVEGVALEGRRVLVIGAGGSARAAVMGLGRAGAGHVLVAARREPRARALVEALRPVLAGTELAAAQLDEVHRVARELDLVVHTTPATLRGGSEADALVAALPWSRIGGHAFVLDVVYAHEPTALVTAARARGLHASDGVEMLVQQGALALERWLGVDAPRDVMREAVLGALGRSPRGVRRDLGAPR